MKKILAFLAVPILALAVAFGGPAFAQGQTPTPPGYSVLGGQVSLAVSNSSTRVALPASITAYGAVTVYNKGTVDAYVALGGSSIVATSNGTCTNSAGAPPGASCLVAAGTVVTFWASSGTYVAAITASSTTSLIIYQASGPVQLSVINPSAAGLGVASVTNSDGSLTFSPTTGAVVGSINVAHGNTFTAAQMVNTNSASAPAPDTGALLSVVGADATASIIDENAFGATPSIIERRADGTGALPTAVQANDVLANFGARPYDGSAYPSASVGNVQVLALENFTTAHHGAGVGIICTAITTLTTAQCGEFMATGLNLPTGETYQINGAQIASANLSDTANIALLNAANTFTNNQVVSAHSFGLSGNITGAAIFGTNGIRYKNVAGTLSDTTSSGTVATNYDSAFGGNTLTATSATTITNNYGTYFTAPVCSTNVTCTANFALGADSANIGGSVLSSSGIASIGFVTATAAQKFNWSGRSQMKSPSDGVIEFSNNVDSGLTGLKLGGVTSSFPYIKVNGAAINFRLADDSGDAAITASAITTSAQSSMGGGINMNSGSITNLPTLQFSATGSGLAFGPVGNAVTHAAWTTSGNNFRAVAATFTDSSSSGTVAAQYVNAFKAPTVAASSSTTYTNSYNTYFEAPVAGTNVTQTNAWALGADSVKVTGAGVNFSGIGQSTAADVLCYAVSTGLVTYEPTGTTCTVSALRFKRDIVSQSDDRDFGIIMGMRPVSFRYKPGIDDGGTETHYGFIAEEVQKVAPELVAWEPDGKQLHGVKYAELSPYIVGAMQKEQAEIASLKSENARLRAANDNFDRRLAALEHPKRKIASN